MRSCLHRGEVMLYKAPQPFPRNAWFHFDSKIEHLCYLLGAGELVVFVNESDIGDQPFDSLLVLLGGAPNRRRTRTPSQRPGTKLLHTTPAVRRVFAGAQSRVLRTKTLRGPAVAVVSPSWL